MSFEKILYVKVKIAREACAGSDRCHYDQFPTYLQEAMIEAVCIRNDIYMKLLDVKNRYKKSKTLSDRIEYDRILCDVLNNDLKGSG